MSKSDFQVSDSCVLSESLCIATVSFGNYDKFLNELVAIHEFSDKNGKSQKLTRSFRTHLRNMRDKTREDNMSDPNDPPLRIAQSPRYPAFLRTRGLSGGLRPTAFLLAALMHFLPRDGQIPPVCTRRRPYKKQSMEVLDVNRSFWSDHT